MSDSGKMEIKAILELSPNEELYKLIDFLNKNLKQKDLVFGLAQKDGHMVVTIYET
ncbi:MAG: YpmA family protein [Firmicutes bacterium]|nr:YpmA family protein [Bacillota bacterium]